MGTVKYEVSAVQNLLTTELNNLANNAAALSGAFDNGDAGNLYFEADFELLAAFDTNPTAGSLVEMYLIPALDGTNYADGSTTGPVTPLNHYVGGFSLRATTDAQRIYLRGVQLPPETFKVLVVNKSGQAMHADNNTLRMLAKRIATT